jgi:hypothetical protein
MGLEGIESKRLRVDLPLRPIEGPGSSRRTPDAPAVKREAEEEKWGKERWR